MALTTEQQAEHLKHLEWLAELATEERYWLLKIAYDHRGTTERDPLSLGAK